MLNQVKAAEGRSFRIGRGGERRAAAIPVHLLPNIMKAGLPDRDSVAASLPGVLAIVDGHGEVIGLGIKGADMHIGQRRAAGYAFGDVHPDEVYSIGSAGLPGTPWTHIEIVEAIVGEDGQAIG